MYIYNIHIYIYKYITGLPLTNNDWYTDMCGQWFEDDDVAPLSGIWLGCENVWHQVQRMIIKFIGFPDLNEQFFGLWTNPDIHRYGAFLKWETRQKTPNWETAGFNWSPILGNNHPGDSMANSPPNFHREKWWNTMMFRLWIPTHKHTHTSHSLKMERSNP